MEKSRLKQYSGIRYPKEVKEKVVHAIVTGELLLVEAMEKYNVPIRATVVAWLKKYCREQEKLARMKKK
ncbi:hypothetical protein [Sphingobacterium sp. SYP-B4668]|uniref:hypothetical protein n=1 Tax=Sphingobacterium sp. SYP-B4668 TaxID=2996035 RepID=UPI0022DDFA6E|nr:hypothetical protein [Sphingobacterium sp. SYP-B4668]